MLTRRPPADAPTEPPDSQRASPAISVTPAGLSGGRDRAKTDRNHRLPNISGVAVAATASLITARSNRAAQAVGELKKSVFRERSREWLEGLI
jgi:hypothetical protein